MFFLKRRRETLKRKCDWCKKKKDLMPSELCLDCINKEAQMMRDSIYRPSRLPAIMKEICKSMNKESKTQ